MENNTINLTKKAVGDSRLRISDDGQHVTNGHWAIKKSLLKQAALLTTVEAAQALFPRAVVESMSADMMKLVVPNHSDPVTYDKTHWIQCTDYQEAVLFVGGDDGDSQMWISRRYVDMFKLEAFVSQAAPGKVGRDPGLVGERDDWNLIIMPLLMDYQPGLR